MNSYRQLAFSYDELTGDVAYERRADYLEKLFRRAAMPVHTVLDLACGTGSMTWLLARRGYEMIAVDGSADMLAVAMAKAEDVGGEAPIFLHQSMHRLDLYGTVDAAVCCLDSLNYLTRPDDLRRTLERLRLFIAPGGLLVFDVNTEEKFRMMDGQVFLDETEDAYCIWRTAYRRRICTYHVDLFRRCGALWHRSEELHRQRYYDRQELCDALAAAGFGRVRVYGDCRMRPPRQGEQRVYFSCVRL